MQPDEMNLMHHHIQQNPLAVSYMNTFNPIIPGVIEAAQNLKNTIRHKIYHFVLPMVGYQYASKITDMLLDLPLEEIKEYLQDFNELEKKVCKIKTSLINQSQLLMQNVLNLPFKEFKPAISENNSDR